MRRSLAVLSAVLVGATHALGQDGPAVAPLTLGELEEKALAKDPTVSQAAAAVKAAEGRFRQAGLKPNPVIGFRGEELTTDRLKQYRQHEYFGYLEQSILTGRKLKRGRSVALHARAEAEAHAEVQRQAVRNAVRGLYHEAQVAQRLVEVR